MHDVLLSIIALRKMERKQAEVEYWAAEDGQETIFFVSPLLLLSNHKSILLSVSLFLFHLCHISASTYK